MWIHGSWQNQRHKLLFVHSCYICKQTMLKLNFGSQVLASVNGCFITFNLACHETHYYVLVIKPGFAQEICIQVCTRFVMHLLFSGLCLIPTGDQAKTGVILILFWLSDQAKTEVVLNFVLAQRVFHVNSSRCLQNEHKPRKVVVLHSFNQDVPLGI